MLGSAETGGQEAAGVACASLRMSIGRKGDASPVESPFAELLVCGRQEGTAVNQAGTALPTWCVPSKGGRDIIHKQIHNN